MNHEPAKNTRVAVPTTDRPRAMDARADRSARTPAARTTASRSVLTDSAADVALSIVLGISFALLTLHGLNALFQ